ncbi:exported hypothetical protein [Mesorhizobium plurifarium]|uniref:Twin-arginine translocation signal domain-containing protein n=1 Tax=Mesorhizobium plurifarium TaxID=69974 RepID=A0A090EF33_MESPL|nr:exported hypothetical protein [Mesorhizobium plurifarium]
MTDLSRRNFLKGLMAAAGVAAVGIPLAPAVAEIVPEPPPLPFPDADVGDIFMQVANAWRFIGRSSRMQIKVDRDEEETWISPSERRYTALRTVSINADGEGVFDSEGERLLHSQFVEYASTDFAVGQGRYGVYVLKKSFISQIDRHFSLDGGAVKTGFKLVVSGMEISREG